MIKLSQAGILYKETMSSSPKEVSIEMARVSSLLLRIGTDVALENVILLLTAIVEPPRLLESLSALIMLKSLIFKFRSEFAFRKVSDRSRISISSQIFNSSPCFFKSSKQ